MLKRVSLAPLRMEPSARLNFGPPKKFRESQLFDDGETGITQYASILKYGWNKAKIYRTER